MTGTVATALRSLVAWCLGLLGTVGAARGWGPTDFPASSQGAGLTRIVAITGVVVLVGMMWRSRPYVVVAASLVSIPLAAVSTAANLGRAPGIVASLSVVVAWAAIVPVGRPRRGAQGAVHRLAGPNRTVLLAVLLVAAAQVCWILDVRGAAVGLLAAAAGAVALAAAAPDAIEPVERLLRGSGTDRAGRSVARVGDVGVDLRRRIVEAPGWVWWAVLAAVVMALVMAPVFARFAAEPASVLGFGDYEVHLDVASRVEFFPPRVGAPHPVFHLAVAATSWLGGPVVATTLVMSIVMAGTVLVLVWFGRRPFAGRGPVDPALAIAYGVGYLLVEAPGKIAAALRIGNPYDWSPTNHMYLSPTDTMLVPFAVVLVYLLGRTVRCADFTSRGSNWTLAAATVAATVVKPSMTLPLIVALPVVLVLSGRFDRSTLSHLFTRFYVPSAVVLALQTWMLEAGLEGIPKAGIAIRPMETVRMVGLDQVGPLLFAPLLVVVICLWADRRRYLAEPVVQLSLWSMVASLGILFLLNETGERSADGTFTKPAFISFIVLHLVSWRFLAGEYRFGADGRRRMWVRVAGAFLVVGTIAGVLAYLDAAGVIALGDRARM